MGKRKEIKEEPIVELIQEPLFKFRNIILEQFKGIRGWKVEKSSESGRERLYEEPYKLLVKGLDYIEFELSRGGKITFTGMAIYVGFVGGRKTLYQYEKYDEAFYDVIETLKNIIENYYEEHLLTQSFNGARFALSSSSNWTPKIEQTVNVQNIELDMSNE